jgi:hypothetical protein
VYKAATMELGLGWSIVKFCTSLVILYHLKHFTQESSLFGQSF